MRTRIMIVLPIVHALRILLKKVRKNKRAPIIHLNDKDLSLLK